MFGYNSITQKMLNHAELIAAGQMLRISMDTAIANEEYLLNIDAEQGASIKEALFGN